MVLKAIHGKITFVITLLFIASSAPVLAAGLKTEFVYDAVGNLRHLSAPNGETSYDYDVLDRVTGESGPAATTTYTYDANGNRLTGLGATLTYPPLSAPSSRVSTRQVGATTYSYAYDSTTFGSTGNVVNDGTFQYVYTSRGQIKQVKQGATVIATYTYDYQNRRTRKVVGSTTTMYHYNQEGLLIAETSSTNVAQKTYAYRGGVPVGQIDHGSPVKVTYLFSDNLGTPRSGRDVSKNIVWTWYSDAFGSSTANADPDGNSILTNVNLRLPGQYFDAESGLHYNWNRLYDAKIGRYLQSDPIGLNGGINTYTYANSNPLRYVDPTGENPAIPVVAVACLTDPVCVAAVGVSLNCLINPSACGDVIGSICDATSAASDALEDFLKPVLSQDKQLTPGEIKKLKGKGIDPEQLKGGKSTGSKDLYKDKKGNIVVKPKGGGGPGEPTGINVNDP